MKRILLTLAFALGIVLNAFAQKETYNVLAAYVGTLNAQSEVVWGNRKLKVSSIEIDNDARSFKIIFKKGKVEEYRLLGENGDASYAVVTVHEKMSREGWDVTDYFAENQWGHSALIRKRTHAKEGKIQYFVYGRGVYGFDVEPKKE